MNKPHPQTVLLGLLALVILSLALTLLASQRMAPAGPAGAAAKPAPLPADADFTVTGYRYTDEGGDLKIILSGKEITRRGRRLLGLRSTVAKNNYLKELQGIVRTPDGILEFSASEAEWDAEASHPLLLQENPVISLDGKTLPQARRAKIYFKQRVVVTDTGKLTSYPF